MGQLHDIRRHARRDAAKGAPDEAYRRRLPGGDKAEYDDQYEQHAAKLARAKGTPDAKPGRQAGAV